MKPDSSSSVEIQVIAEDQLTTETVLAVESDLKTIDDNYQRDDLSAFFGIGIVVNLTMFVVLVFWGYSQWKKQNERKK